MKMLICLHGNPLQGQEFEPIIPYLKKMGLNTIVHKRPLKGAKLESLLQSINATAKVHGGGPFTLLAYSWGAFLALSYLQRFPENLKNIILVNPLIVDQKPISDTAKLLHHMPIMRSMVHKLKSRRKKITRFIQRTFDPLEPSDEAIQVLQPYLKQAQVWRGAMEYRKLMEKHPLSHKFPTCNVPVQVIFGERDDVAPMEQQQKFLDLLIPLKCVSVKEAGHSLPWTHQEAILQVIKENVFD